MKSANKSDAKVVIYTLNYCPYCSWVKELFKKRGIAFQEIDFTGNDALRAEIAERSGRNTAPQVFVRGKSIGGYEDVKRLDDQGLLSKLLLRVDRC
ncbi:MAG: glutaredoxin [Candidatus Omnitrophica bacterium]|nr:glutaredoxin [Candidatus Omnitrophota bacterium]